MNKDNIVKNEDIKKNMHIDEKTIKQALLAGERVTGTIAAHVKVDTEG